MEAEFKKLYPPELFINKDDIQTGANIKVLGHGQQGVVLQVQYQNNTFALKNVSAQSKMDLKCAINEAYTLLYVDPPNTTTMHFLTYFI